MSAVADLLAYGRHFPTCTKGRLIARTRRGDAIRNPDCTCGYDKAVRDAMVRRAAPGSLDQRSNGRSVNPSGSRTEAGEP